MFKSVLGLSLLAISLTARTSVSYQHYSSDDGRYDDDHEYDHPPSLRPLPRR